MLKIEFVAYLDGTVIQSDYDNHVLYVDYCKWVQLDKQQRRYIIEDANQHYGVHQRWKSERENKAQFNSAGATVYAYAKPERTILLSTHEALLESAVAELGKWRELARRLVEADSDSWSNESRGEYVEPIMEDVAALLSGCAKGVTTDKARMSVDSDEDIDWGTCVQCGSDRPCTCGETKEWKNYIIRAWSEPSQQVVYWQEKWAWGPDRKTARRFTRMKALELANSTNTVFSEDIINVCAIKEID